MQVVRAVVIDCHLDHAFRYVAEDADDLIEPIREFALFDECM
jgi:hypothetical protein